MNVPVPHQTREKKYRERMSTAFAPELTSMLTRLVHESGMSLNAVAEDAGISKPTLLSVMEGKSTYLTNVLGILYAIDATDADVHAIYIAYADMRARLAQDKRRKKDAR